MVSESHPLDLHITYTTDTTSARLSLFCDNAPPATYSYFRLINPVGIAF